MRFLVMVKPKGANAATYESGKFPESASSDFEKMGAFNQTLVNDGWVLELGGLKPTSAGTRIDFSGTKPAVTDGPFSETKELVGGFWLLEAPSKQALVDRLQQCPMPYGETLEIRPLFTDEDLADFV